MKHFSFLIFSLALLALIQNSFAATIIVTTTTDEVTTNGKCSLREAIVNMNQGKDSYPDCANTSSGSYATNDTIQLEGKTYCLSLSDPISDTEFFGDLDIKKAVTISGQSQSSTLIDAGHRPKESGKKSTCAKALNDRVLHVHKNIADVVTLKNLTIAGGLLKNSDKVNEGSSFLSYIYHLYYGAGVYAQSNLDLESVTVSGNAFDIPSNKGDNYYLSHGGGIYTSNSTLTITDSIISGNRASEGGGIHTSSSTATITNSTISENRAKRGGGIHTSSSTLTITNSTISANLADNDEYGYGGGMWSSYSKLHITNSTISGNSADKGGGIYNDVNSSIKIASSTISQNAANHNGGGIFFYYNILVKQRSNSVVELKNTLIAGNIKIGVPGNDCYSYFLMPNGNNDRKQFISHGYNFVTDDSGCIFTEQANAGTNITDKSFFALQLSPLADNGGGTQTHALLAGSPAIDSGSCTDIDGKPITTDQRGHLRPTEKCDIGAYEKDVVASTPNNMKKSTTQKSNSGCSLTTATQQSSVSGFMLMMLAIGAVALIRQRVV